MGIEEEERQCSVCGGEGRNKNKGENGINEKKIEVERKGKIREEGDRNSC